MAQRTCILLVGLAFMSAFVCLVSLQEPIAQRPGLTVSHRRAFFVVSATEWRDSVELVRLARQLESRGFVIIHDAETIPLSAHTRVLYFSPEAFLTTPRTLLRQFYFEEQLIIVVLDTPLSQISQALNAGIGMSDLLPGVFTEEAYVVAAVLYRFPDDSGVYRDFIPTEMLLPTLSGQTEARLWQGDNRKSSR